MLQSFTQIQKFGQDNLDATMKALGAFSSNTQAIATETADFARKSFEQHLFHGREAARRADPRQGC